MADLTTITLTPSNPYIRSPPPTTTPTPTTTTPETDTETPPTKPTTDHHHHHHSKILSFTNGSLKNHHHHYQNHQLTTPRVVVYKECLKNHAASLGGHALDGCGEFMPLSTATATDPTSLKCSACGCHRNFHRREPKEGCGGGGGGAATQIIDFQAHHQIPTPTKDQSPTNSISPPPISPTYYQSSAPHMLLALSAGLSRPSTKMTKSNPIMGNGGRKRFRSKFSQEQKEKMYCFSEKVGWKIQKRDEGIVEEFCNEVGIGKNVLKVWMHNNKYTFGKRDFNGTSSSHVVTNGFSSSS